MLAVGLAVAAVCLAFVHGTRSDAYWTGDCANKALVAARLLETGFRDPSFDYPAVALDPERRAFPLPALGVPRGGGHVSVFPVAYPALSAPFLALLGPPGLRWPAALGTGACAALFALWLMPAVGRRVALGAGAGFGLATPLFFYGTTVWEHSLTVALVLGAAVALQRPGVKPALGAGAAIGLAAWLREELALLGVVLVALELLHARASARALALAAGGGVFGAALAVFNQAVYGSVLGPHAAALDPALALAGTGAAELATRIASLLVGRAGSAPEAWALSGLAVVALALTVVLERRAPGGLPAFALGGALGLGAFALALVHVLDGPPLLGLVRWNGLLPQVPLVALAGIGCVRAFRSEACEPLRPGILAGLGFLLVAAVLGLVTQSVFGMGLHVGPRKLLPALPALAALAVLAVCTAPATRAARTSGALLALAGLSASGLAGILLLHQKAESGALQDRLRERPERFAVSGDAMLTQALSGIWHDTPLLFAPQPDVLRPLVAEMRRQRVESFLAIASQATPTGDPTLRVQCRPLPPHRGAVIGYWDTDLATCALR